MERDELLEKLIKKIERKEEKLRQLESITNSNGCRSAIDKPAESHNPPLKQLPMTSMGMDRLK